MQKQKRRLHYNDTRRVSSLLPSSIAHCTAAIYDTSLPAAYAESIHLKVIHHPSCVLKVKYVLCTHLMNLMKK